MENKNKIPVLAEAVTTYRPNVKPSDMPQFRTAMEVVYLARPQWAGIWNYETAKVVLVNNKNRILGIETVGQGGIETCQVDIKLALQKAIAGNAVGMVLMHNHPSGSAIPSEQDVTLTMRMSKACEACGLKLLDHVVITEDEYYSFASETELIKK